MNKLNIIESFIIGLGGGAIIGLCIDLTFMLNSPILMVLCSIIGAMFLSYNTYKKNK